MRNAQSRQQSINAAALAMIMSGIRRMDSMKKQKKRIRSKAYFRKRYKKLFKSPYHVVGMDARKIMAL